MTTKREEIESGCLSRCADDEPVFVLRARDEVAPSVVIVWALMARLAGVPEEKVREAMSLSGKMERWQEKHGSKKPD